MSIQGYLAGKVGAPAADLIGFKMVSHKRGEACFEMEAGRKHTNPMGTVHGGILCAIADAAMGTAFGTTLEEGESFTSLELKINFIRPVWDTRLKAVGRVVERGRTIGVVECEVRDENERLVAVATGTCMVLRGEKAVGR